MLCFSIIIIFAHSLVSRSFRRVHFLLVIEGAQAKYWFVYLCDVLV